MGKEKQIKQDLKESINVSSDLKDGVSLSFMGGTLQFQGGQVLGFKRKVYGAVNIAQFSFPFRPHKVETDRKSTRESGSSLPSLFLLCCFSPFLCCLSASKS